MKKKYDELLEMQLNDYDIEKAKSKAETLEASLSLKEEELAKKIQALEKLRHQLKSKENVLGAQNRKIRTHQLIVLGAELDRVIEKDIDVSSGSNDLIALRKYLTKYHDAINKALQPNINFDPDIEVESFEELP